MAAHSTLLQTSRFIPSGTTYDTETGKITTKTISTINKYILYSSVPEDVTFSYTVSKVDGYEEDAVLQQGSTSGSTTYEEVRNGVDPGSVKFTSTNSTTGTLSFDINDFNNGGEANTLADLGVTDSGDQRKYAEKSFVVDFSDVTFSNPGVYRYVMTETSSNDKIPASGSLYFDVWVTRNSAVVGTDGYNTFGITAIVAHTDTNAAIDTSNSNAVSGKTSYLKSISVQKAMNLTVKHYSLGNQASKTENYKYTLTLRDATKGSTIAYVRSDGKNGSITVTADGLSSYGFYLKDKEAITFLNISEYPGYTVSADEATMTDEGLTTATKLEYYQLATAAIDSTTNDLYPVSPDNADDKNADTKTDEVKSGSGSDVHFTDGSAITVNGVLANAISQSESKYTVNDTMLTSNTTVVFSVYKQGTVPTGVIVTVAPYAAVILAGFFGLIIFAVKRKDKNEEEEA